MGIPRIADVDGTLYVAGRVGRLRHRRPRRRLGAAGTDWVEVGDKLVHSPTGAAFRPSIASIGGVPWVAWLEADGGTSMVRVARLDDTGTGWIEVVGGANPINHDATKNSYDPSIADVGGVPYVAWAESPRRTSIKRGFG